MRPSTPYESVLRVMHADISSDTQEERMAHTPRPSADGGMGGMERQDH